MASLRKLVGKYTGRTTHIGRGRDNDGKDFDIPMDIPIEPKGLVAGHPSYAKAKRALAKHALEEANSFEARVRGELTEEEYEARAKFRAKKVLKQHSTATTALFIIAWLWEHVIRNRLDYTKTLFLCNLADRLLESIPPAKKKTIHDVRQKHFDAFLLDMRLAKYSPGVVNNTVDYLRNLGRDILKATGNDVSAGLRKEASDHDEKLPFSADNISHIFQALPGETGHLLVEWTIFLLVMLYTEMRPNDVRQLKRSDIRLEEGVIRILSGKTKNFRSKFDWKPMHRCLLKYITDYLSDVKLNPDDPLCMHFYHMSEKSLSNKFTEVLEAAKIEQERFLGENRINEFSPKSLYSMKHTAYVWLDAAGALEDEADEHSNSTPQSQGHYKHKGYQDPVLLEMRRKKVNRMPTTEVSYESDKKQLL